MASCIQTCIPVPVLLKGESHFKLTSLAGEVLMENPDTARAYYGEDEQGYEKHEALRKEVHEFMSKTEVELEEKGFEETSPASVFDACLDLLSRMLDCTGDFEPWSRKWLKEGEKQEVLEPLLGLATDTRKSFLRVGDFLNVKRRTVSETIKVKLRLLDRPSVNVLLESFDFAECFQKMLSLETEFERMRLSKRSSTYSIVVADTEIKLECEYREVFDGAFRGRFHPYGQPKLCREETNVYVTVNSGRRRLARNTKDLKMFIMR